MAITKITDHATRAANALIEQYKTKPKLVGLLTAFVNQVQKLEDGFFPLLSLLDLGPVNLAPDSSFESDSNGDGLADAWDLYNNGPEAATFSRVTGGLFGTWAQRVSWSVANTTTKGINTRSNIVGGGIQWKRNTTFNISWNARALGTVIGQKMQTAWNQAPTLTEILNPPLTADYQRYAWKAAWGSLIPGDVAGTAGEMYLSIFNGASCIGSVDFDGVLVTEGSDLLDYQTTGANLDLLGRIVGEPRLGRSDLSYRTFIQAKILLNISSGAVEELYAIFALLLSVNGIAATMQVAEYFPKAFTLRLQGAAVPDAVAADLAKVLKSAKDAGAMAFLDYSPVAPPGGFDGPTGFDGTASFGGSL